MNYISDRSYDFKELDEWLVFRPFNSLILLCLFAVLFILSVSVTFTLNRSSLAHVHLFFIHGFTVRYFFSIPLHSCRFFNISRISYHLLLPFLSRDGLMR